MSSPPCLGTVVERTCGFELDILKSTSPSSSSARSTCSSECSSVAISTKRARTPRKRPNQAYAEAALLLSAVYPNVFNSNSLPKFNKNHHFSPFSSSKFATNYLIEEELFAFAPSPKHACRVEFNPASSCAGFCEPGSPDYDVESILDEDVGVDSIMGKVSTEEPDILTGPHAVGFGYLLAQSDVLRRALRGGREEWWSASKMVEVKDIVPVLPPPPATKKKKSNKKKKKVVKDVDDPQIVDAVPAAVEKPRKPCLGLKLNYDDVADAWSDKSFPFTKEAGAPEFSADAIAKLAELDLTPESEGGGAREASVQRFREKRRTRLFSKKIRYQVRKVNADCRPRMKASGRFIRRPSPLEDAEENEDEEIK